MRLPEPPVLLITDRRLARGPLAAVLEAAFAGGVRWASLREKDLAPDALAELVAALLPLARRWEARLTLHGDAALAARLGLAGVHLPRTGDVAAARRRIGGERLVGLSAHDREEALRAQRAGADYVSLSPIFPSPSKPGYGPPLGLAGLADASAALDLPVLALGGVDASNAGRCLEAGAAGVAVMGAIMAAKDPEAAARRLVTAVARTARPPRSPE